MSEQLPGQIIGELRATHPGVVEEWERQRTENEDWGFPDFQATAGLVWWLYSEVNLARMAGEVDDDTEEDDAIADFCLQAIRRIWDAQDNT